METQLRWAGVGYGHGVRGGLAGAWGAGAGVSHHRCFGISLGAAFGPLMHQAPSAAC